MQQMSMMPQQPQQGYKPAYNGIGFIPMATTSDRKLKCYYPNCNYVGSGVCKWNNCCLRSKKRGGCGRRYCHTHKYEKI